MSLALIFIITGLVISFGAFIFVIINMLRGRDNFGSFNSKIVGHVVAMIIIVFGGLLFFVGLILLGVDILNRVIG